VIQVPTQPNGTLQPQVLYGRLEAIYVCNLPVDTFWGSFSGTTRLLAMLTPCKTLGKDAANEKTSYTHMTKPIIIDLRTIVAVVGRVETRGRWAIIDRTGGLVKPTFLEDEEDEMD